MNEHCPDSKNGVCPEQLRVICGAVLEFEFEFELCCFKFSTVWESGNKEEPETLDD